MKDKESQKKSLKTFILAKRLTKHWSVWMLDIHTSL